MKRSVVACSAILLLSILTACSNDAGPVVLGNQHSSAPPPLAQSATPTSTSTGQPGGRSLTLADVNAALLEHPPLAPGWERDTAWEAKHDAVTREKFGTTAPTSQTPATSDACPATRGKVDPIGQQSRARTFRHVRTDATHGIIITAELMASEREAQQAINFNRLRATHCPNGFTPTDVPAVGDDRIGSYGKTAPMKDGSQPMMVYRLVRVGRILVLQRTFGTAPDQAELADVLLKRQVTQFETMIREARTAS